MPRLSWKILLVVTVSLAAAPLHAQETTLELRVDSLEVRIDSLSAVHDSLTQLRAGMLVRSSSLAARVDRLRGGTALGPLDKYRLNSALAASQNLADSLDVVNWRLDGLEQQIDGLRLDAVSACTAALDSLSRLMKTTLAASPKSVLASQFDQLRERRQRLAAAAGGEQEQPRRIENNRISLRSLAGLVEIEPGDSPEEIAEKSAFLSDVELRWSRALDALERNIGMLDEEREMRSRLGEFTQELALFDETGPSSRTRTVSNDGAAADQPREELIQRKDNTFSDFSIATESKQMAESIAYDIQIGEPEIELKLMQSMDRFSSGDIADLVGVLQARRDSLASDLKSLKSLHEQFKKKAGLD